MLNQEDRNIKEYIFFKKLCSMPFINKIILYGSRARGDNRERSDIDLAIECPQATISQWLTIVNVINDADTLLKIDFVRLDQLEKNNPLRHSIEQEGIVLYERKS